MTSNTEPWDMSGARAKAARAPAWLRGVTAVVDFSDNTKALYRALEAKARKDDFIGAVVEWVHNMEDPTLDEMNLAITLWEQKVWSNDSRNGLLSYKIKRTVANKNWDKGKVKRVTGKLILVSDGPDYTLSLSDEGIEYLLGLR